MRIFVVIGVPVWSLNAYAVKAFRTEEKAWKFLAELADHVSWVEDIEFDEKEPE